LVFHKTVGMSKDNAWHNNCTFWHQCG